MRIWGSCLKKMVILSVALLFAQAIPATAKIIFPGTFTYFTDKYKSSDTGLDQITGEKYLTWKSGRFKRALSPGHESVLYHTRVRCVPGKDAQVWHVIESKRLWSHIGEMLHFKFIVESDGEGIYQKVKKLQIDDSVREKNGHTSIKVADLKVSEFSKLHDLGRGQPLVMHATQFVAGKGGDKFIHTLRFNPEEVLQLLSTHCRGEPKYYKAPRWEESVVK